MFANENKTCQQPLLDEKSRLSMQARFVVIDIPYRSAVFAVDRQSLGTATVLIVNP
jgi:hypothetical protein